MNLPSTHGLALWLLPDSDTADKASVVIRDLARLYGTPRFAPHVTLSGVPVGLENHPNLIRMVRNMAFETGPFSVPVLSVRCRENPYQKISAELKPTPGLVRLFRAADSMFNGSFAKRGYPHLSLLYGTLSCRRLRNTHKMFEPPFLKNIVLEKLALVNLEGGPDEWDILRRIPLGKDPEV